MPRLPFRSITPPRDPRWSWIAVLVSLAVHSLLFLVKVGSWLPPRPPVERIILIPLGTEGPQAVTMVYREPSGGGARNRPKTSGISTLPSEDTGPIPEVTPVDTVSVAVEPVEPSVDTAGPGPVRTPGRAPIRPGLGEGKLWVRPLPLPPQDLARAVVRTRAEIADSIVTVIVQTYIDSVLASAPDNAPLPSWTTRIGEKQLGIDSKWIYLGPIKIPTALLGLIMPNVSSAEMTDYTKFRQLQQMREDVAYAARRAERMEDFKRAIKELRAEREREREFAKNQKTAPKPKSDSSTPPPPPPP